MIVRALEVLAALVVLGGCASPPPGGDTARQQAVARMDAQRASASAAPEREARYYVDEQGLTWDDRGRRIERTPAEAASRKP